MSNPEERERAPRLTASLTVVLSAGEAPYVVEVENVSETGLLLRPKELFPVGTKIHLVFGQPPELPRISAEGIVRWSEEEKGMGVEFTTISPADHQALVNFMKLPSRSE
jgi:hypothetical protein